MRCVSLNSCFVHPGCGKRNLESVFTTFSPPNRKHLQRHDFSKFGYMKLCHAGFPKNGFRVFLRGSCENRTLNILAFNVFPARGSKRLKWIPGFSYRSRIHIGAIEYHYNNLTYKNTTNTKQYTTRIRLTNHPGSI
jgi:hypothetical protein